MSKTNDRGVVLLASDLMMNSTVSGFANSADVPFSSVAAIDEIGTSAAASEILLLVDLGLPGLDVQKLADCVSPDTLQRAVAYGPHVHREKLEAARAAGIGRVMSRGQFTAEIGSIIAAFCQD